MADATLTEDEIKTLVIDWYKALDVHEPQVSVMRFLDPDELHMKFPEATLEGLAAFEGWYQGVIRIFFDEVHEVDAIEIGEPEDGRYPVKVVVHWQASRWNAPSPTSDRIDMVAYQTWKVRRASNGTAAICFYSVDDIKFNPGSAKL